MECEKCSGDYFETTESLKFREECNIYAKQLSVKNRNISDGHFESVHESDLEKQAGNSRLTEDNILDKEYVDELDVGSNISVESNSTDVAGLPGVSQVMTLDLIKERYPFITEVSGFTIEETGTDDKMKKPPSAADDATIIYSDCLLTHIAEPKETIGMTDIDSGEDIPTDSKTLSSHEESIRTEHSGPYYCPDCGKGQGYSLNSLQLHVAKNKGFCKQNNSGRTFYTCPHCKSDYVDLRSLKKHNTKFGLRCKTWQISKNNRKLPPNFQAGTDIPQRVQSMEVTDSEPARDYTKPHLITDEDSNPYYCPDCGRCLGYSYKVFQIHISRYARHCKAKFAGKRLYGCKYCHHEFLELSTLATHYKTFGDSCKTRQITMNSNNFSFNYSTDIPKRVQSMEVTDSEPARDYTKPHLITEEESNPYYCPDCGQCLGYSYKIFQTHISMYKGHCKEKFAGSTLYGCKYCKQEFSKLYSLVRHYKTFGDACKTRQITMNSNNFSFNYSTDIPQRVQSMEVTDSEPARDYTKPHLITEEDSNPYYCPDCGRCLGYSYNFFQKHISMYTGHCKVKFAGSRLYGCKYCKLEYHALHDLATHYKTFGDACKTRQITMNKKKHPIQLH